MFWVNLRLPKNERQYAMDKADQRALEILEGLGRRPATPFYEEGPAQYIIDALAAMGVEHSRDQFGNIVATLGTPNANTPAVALVAHMDHPGFEIIEADGVHATARAVGGVPTASLLNPTRVLVLLPDGDRISATTGRHENTTDPTDRRAERLVTLSLDHKLPAAPPLPVIFDLPDFEMDGDTITMRALDDLAGCASILAALERASTESHDAPIYGVFTRAEEGGLFGARLLAEEGTLPSGTIVVSVESSSVIPGVEQGKGPVIRTGDAMTTFDGDAEQVLSQAARHLATHEKGFRVQRQLMSGGVCEATAFSVHGYPVTGLAFPLGNYHNATTSIPDPDGGVGAEYIELADFLGGVDLLAKVARGQHSGSPSDLFGPVSEDVRKRLEAFPPR
jgi:putative aminopeptidase FrvX